MRDTPKLDRSLRDDRGVHVLHKAGWISTARHDTGLVFWRGGVFVAERDDVEMRAAPALAPTCSRAAWRRSAPSVSAARTLIGGS